MAPVSRLFHDVDVDGRPVQLRVFVPVLAPAQKDKAEASEIKRPAVVMVCGLLWLGEGLLGRIGLMFNDGFGYAFARCGAPCVQIHTPCRHIARTRMMEVLVALVWPLGFFPSLRLAVVIMDALMLMTSPLHALPLLLWPWLSSFGVFAVPVAHLLIRVTQWATGALAADHRDHQKEIAAAVAWTKDNHKMLGTDGRLVLCGYSSGGHCAALYGITPGAPKFEAVVLISGIYGIRTHAWTGMRKLFLAPLCDMLFRDILGASTESERDRMSPEFLCARMALPGKAALPAEDWYVLSAKKELMGLEPFQDILFHTQELCEALTGKGAKVHKVTCGLNHWLLVLKIEDFVRPFCESLVSPSPRVAK